MLEALAAERKVLLQGGPEEIMAFARAARDLMEGKRTDHAELACFYNWAEVQEYVDEDEQGSELRLLVKLVDDFAVEVLLDELAKLPKTAADADLVVSTAHKSKGREWDTVQLASDFPEDAAKIGTDELRLLYVACTRARIELDITAVTVLTQGLVRPQEAAPVEDDTEAAPEAPEALQAIVSAHVGNVGDTVELPLRCEVAIGMQTDYGWTYLTTLVDDTTGNVFQAFIKYELSQGTSYQVNARIKKHGEHRGTKTTNLNYVTTEEIVEAPKPGARARRPDHRPLLIVTTLDGRQIASYPTTASPYEREDPYDGHLHPDQRSRDGRVPRPSGLGRSEPRRRARAGLRQARRHRRP